MNKLSLFFYKKSTLITALLATLLTFGYLFFVLIGATKCFEIEGDTIRSFGLSFGFSAETVKAFFAARNTEMITCFIELHNIWDNIYSILYGVMHVVWLSFIFKPSALKIKWLNLIPFVQVIFDWLENFKMNQLANDYINTGQIDEFDVQLASTFGMIKWSIYGLIILLILIGIVISILNSTKKSKASF